MKKTTIYFLRHGQVYNPQKILYGRLTGFPLSEEGKIKIQELANTLAPYGITSIYTSPMLRTRQTARIIGERLGLKQKVTRLLIETKDVTAGVSLDQFRKEIEPHLYTYNLIKKGQESINSQYQRMRKFVEMIQKLHHGEKILAVSHGDPILILKAISEGNQFTYEYKLENYLQTGDYFILKLKDNSYHWTKKD